MMDFNFIQFCQILMWLRKHYYLLSGIKTSAEDTRLAIRSLVNPLRVGKIQSQRSPRHHSF
jgi:hypothetical protein